ncbi:MAG TPA: hypothetical protein VMW91_00835 [Desulfosporosinus sp.]|nr:hypothetical protein [Desulfosporosinus sp.]
MTQRSVHTTQSKLTVKAPKRGAGYPPNAPAVCYAIHGAPCTRHVLCRRPWRYGGSAHPLAKDGRVSL